MLFSPDIINLRFTTTRSVDKSRYQSEDDEEAGVWTGGERST